jgi:hypothetical protein
MTFISRTSLVNHNFKKYRNYNLTALGISQHKGPAAILGSQAQEQKKVTQTDRAARDGHDDSKT